MSACNVEVIKYVGKYLNTPVGTVCYNTDKVLTTVLDKQNVEGFASIVLRLASKSGAVMSKEQTLLGYQWLEHIAMYANQAISNPTFARSFLEEINRALKSNTYLTGQFLTVTDIAAYHVLYPLLSAESAKRQLKDIPLPKQMYPHELKDANLSEPVVFYPQPFSFPGYPVVVYL